jgi:hypothetical protein
MCYRLPDRWRQFNISRERAVFRLDPVPGTGVKNWKFGNFYKTACCTQERRLYGDPDHRKYSRGKRYPVNLPNSWDDYPKSRAWGYKSWKRVKKKKQWMKKGDNIMSFPTFTPLGAESTADDTVEGVASQKKKLNYNMSETKVKGEDYTRPGKDASQTDDDDLRNEIVEEDYEVTENQKSPERKFGKPGIRLFEGKEEEFIEVLDEDELPIEDDTPVAEDDALKHGSKNKYRLGGDEGKRGTGYMK